MPLLELQREVNQMRKLFTIVGVIAGSLREHEEGQTMAEYGVVLAVITIGAVVAFTALSGGITNSISKVTGLLP
jgi:Flp pilus assembly pilin Flp